MGQITGRDMANRWMEIQNKITLVTYNFLQLAVIPPAENPHRPDLHCQSCVSTNLNFAEQTKREQTPPIQLQGSHAVH